MGVTSPVWRKEIYIKFLFKVNSSSFDLEWCVYVEVSVYTVTLTMRTFILQSFKCHQFFTLISSFRYQKKN